MWDSVPWFVEGGAEHSPQIARLLSYAAFGGREGVIGPRDLEVRAMATPGSQVRVYPGACSLTNRATGAQYESYVGRLPVQDVVSISPTTSSGPRSDLIVVLIKNPWLPGEPWPDPANVALGPYITTEVIPGVAASTTSVQQVRPGWSALTLARIDIPVSTATITQAMVKDLREMSGARNSRDLLIASPPNGVSTAIATTTYGDFPGGADAANCRLTTNVPDWATHVRIRAILGGVKFGAAGTGPNNNGWNFVGDLRLQFGGGSQVSYSSTTAVNLGNDGGVDRATLMCGAPILALPAGDRNKPATIRVEARRTSGNTSLVLDSQATMSIEAEWIQRPESN